LQLNQAIGQDLRAGRDFVEISPRQAPVAGPPDTRTLIFRAMAHGEWGNQLRVRVGPMVGATLNILPDPTLGGAPNRTRIANTPTVNLAAVAGQGTANITVDSAADLQNGDTVIINGAPYVLANVNAGPPATADINPPVPPGNNWTVGTPIIPIIRTITVDSVVNFANNNRVLINGREYIIANVVAGPPATMDVTPSPPPGTIWPQGTTVQLIRAANNPAAPAPVINVWGASQLYRNALVELDNGTNKEVFRVNSVNGNTVTLSGNLARAYFEGHKLRVIEAEVGIRLLRENSQEIEEEETFQNLRLVDEPTGTLSYVVSHINTRSDLVEVAVQPGLSAANLAFYPITAAQDGTAWQELANGANNLNGLTVDDFVGVDGGSGNRTGIQALEDIEEIAICIAPGMWSSTIHTGLIQHCEQLRYRFAIIDSQDSLSIEEIRTVREPIDTKYAALYYPWLRVRDPSVGRNVEIAPSNHIAGIYARVDVERGVHKAPANEIIRGIVLPNPVTGEGGIAQDINKREQDMLNPQGINALRYFPGRGQRVWGARTLSSDSAWKYVNVRRIFIYVEASIDRGTQWVVFEPNDEGTWARVRQTVRNFLLTTWRSGALEGITEEEAFFVRCDRTTMSQDDIDNGRLICVIGIAPVKPAEFVIFRIQQFTRESQ
jgi:phage tail sheath protein FI